MRPNLPAVHETTIHVRWGELDPYRHVNHATYLSYLEHARVAAQKVTGALRFGGRHRHGSIVAATTAHPFQRRSVP